MSINGISNQLMGLQQMAPMRAHEPLAPSEDLALEASIEPAVNITQAKAFYEYQKEPWLTEPGFEDINTRYEYVIHKKIGEHINLALTRLTYSKFIEDLETTHPEVANKKFGFTLNENASIEIIDYNNSLTENDKSVLTNAINNFDTLKSRLQNHAKVMMTLVDHDHETFGSRYKLDIQNFRNIIDFGKILEAPIKQMNAEWVRQIEANAEKLDFSYISLSV